MNDSETLEGALNRALVAIKSKNADFGFGLEGGMNKIGSKWYETGLVRVLIKWPQSLR